MLSDTDRLTDTVEQVLRAGTGGRQEGGTREGRSGLSGGWFVTAWKRRGHVITCKPEALRYEEASPNGRGLHVRGSAEDLRTAVSNVLDNAVKYSGDQIDVRVRLEAPDEKTGIALRVQDQGVGIASDDLKRIFKRFHRVTHSVAGSRQGNGTGTIYREIDRQETRRQGFCRERQARGTGRR